MKPQFVYTGTKDYITHTFINEQRIIPSDSFILGDDEYILLEIMKSTDDIIFMRIIGIKGPDMGSIYLIPKQDFEDKTLTEIRENLTHYQH